ncbi:MAG TPA: class I tRNA ligase family protein [Elusimicrobiota bacterium]|nr:class I tRNA ligase family protein [Elusimicrobiota bacterium]
MTEKIYFTTTLPYANSVPHVGHAIEFFQADAYARYFRKKWGSDNVFFNVGIDENGQKVLTTARDAGKDPQAFVDELAVQWKDFCAKFSISNDYFYRTSQSYHHEGARYVWTLSDQKGDIYKKNYSGLYCVGCESFLLEKDLVDGKCPHHGVEPQRQSEENYFFRLSKYRERLLEDLQKNPHFVQPSSKTAELANFIREMDDISISRNRQNLPWGIEVPGDPSQVIYVWFDALTNYINVLGFHGDKKRFNEFWPGVQFCGPDNLRFQGAIWQGMLASVGAAPTKKLLVHGMIFGPDGQKMSKSLGNVVSPLDQYDKFGADTVRFYMLAVLPTYSDCSYKETELVESYNVHLANNYGNLISRVLHMSSTDGIHLEDHRTFDPLFAEKCMEHVRAAQKNYEGFDLSAAAKNISELLTYGNKYIHDNEPWKKTGVEKEKILSNAYFLLNRATELYEPIIPDKARQAKTILQKQVKEILFPRLK